VNIVEDWDVLEEYAGEKLGFYQILSNDGTIKSDCQRGSVAGKCGFKKEFAVRRH
jgi:hypothetical protein